MNQRLNQTLWGVIALALAVMLIFGHRLPFNAGGLVWAAAGLALIALYRTKRKMWSLILGAYLLYVGAAQLLGSILPFDAGQFFGAAFFLVPGAICAAMYQRGGRRGTLCAASFLLWFGAFLALERWLWIHGGTLFLLFMCAACFTVTVIDGRRGALHWCGWALLVPALLSLGMSTLRVAAAAALLIFGAAAIAGALRRRRGADDPQGGMRTDESGHIIGEWREEGRDE